MLGLFLASLAFASPIIAIFFAARFYVLHCRRRPEQAQRFPVVVYALALLVCAGIGFFLGMLGGVSVACNGPKAGNQCGLFGILVTGPLGASLAVIMIAATILLMPAESPVAAHAPMESGIVEAQWYNKLWRGEYSLAHSFWMFLVLGAIVGTLIRVNPITRLFGPVPQFALLVYAVMACVGVWRSGDRLMATSGGQAMIAAEVIAAKAIAVVLVGWQALVLLRIVQDYSRVRVVG